MEKRVGEGRRKEDNLREKENKQQIKHKCENQ
jgi:hypothetical protein